MLQRKLWPIPPRSGRNFFDFVAPDEVKYPSDDELNCVTRNYPDLVF